MIPEKVRRRARAILDQYARSEIQPRKLAHGVGLCLEVGYRWRLLSRDKGQTWDLMSHEKYNKLTRGKKPNSMR